MGDATLRRRGTAAGICISIHASRGGRDGDAVPRGAALLYFNPRVPWGTRRGHRGEHPSRRGDFNPRVPWGTRPISSLLMSLSSYFNPRVPWGTRPGRCVYGCPYTAFQSTRPVGDATKELSIRARKCRISIHASRGGRDTTTLTCQKLCTVFQSTRPVGDATPSMEMKISSQYFNPRVPWGTRLHLGQILGVVTVISIHASRGGRDSNIAQFMSCTMPHILQFFTWRLLLFFLPRLLQFIFF